MELRELQAAIRERKEAKGALILAHNYQRPEVQQIADVVGDSLTLAQAAAESEAELIVFCGVHFMAEKVLRSLQEEVYQVTVPEEVARRARRALERMLERGRATVSAPTR